MAGVDAGASSTAAEEREVAIEDEGEEDVVNADAVGRSASVTIVLEIFMIYSVYY